MSKRGADIRNDETKWRTLHVLDLENLTGSPRADREAVRSAIEAYCRAVTVKPGDHAVIAMNASNADMAFAARDEWQRVAGCGAVIKVAHGADGADLALLRACDFPTTSSRYGRVVIGSGDHAFADLVIRLRGRGVLVGVCSRATALAHELAAATPVHRYLEAA